jgi:hypothetical protein
MTANNLVGRLFQSADNDADSNFILASSIGLSDHEIDLDVSFSQKIPVGFLPHETVPDTVDSFSFPSQTDDRNTGYRKIRQALHKIFMHSVGCDDRWRKLLAEPSDEETRYVKIGEVLANHFIPQLLNPPRAPVAGPLCYHRPLRS